MKLRKFNRLSLLILAAAGISFFSSCSFMVSTPASVKLTPGGIHHVVAGDSIAYSVNVYSEKGKQIETTGNCKYSFDGVAIEGNVIHIPETFDEDVEYKDYDVAVTYSDAEHGTFTDTAKIRVYPKDYLTKPVTYNGKKYMGMTENTGKPIVSVNDTGKFEITTPALNEITCDGYFYLEGECFNKSDRSYLNKTLAIAIWKFNEQTKTYEYNMAYPLTGSFARRIWLRDGAGIYKVLITTDFDLTRCAINDGVTGTSPLGYAYEGEFIGGITDYIYDSSNKWSSMYTVKNTRDEYGRYTYPSVHIQSDDFEIMNLAEEVASKGTTAEDKARLINQYIVDTYPYDMDSLESYKRKKQDAISVYHFQTAICEGFADIFAALCRYYGMSVRYVDGLMDIKDTSTGHAWNNISFDDGATWFFVEPQSSKNFLKYYISDFNYYPDSETQNYIYYIYNTDRTIDAEDISDNLSKSAEVLNR